MGTMGGLGESHTGNRRESSLKAQLPGEGRACSLGTSRPSWQRPPLSQTTERSIPFHSWPHPSYLSVCLFCPTVQQALSLSRSCLLSRTPLTQRATQGSGTGLPGCCLCRAAQHHPSGDGGGSSHSMTLFFLVTPILPLHQNELPNAHDLHCFIFRMLWVG